MKKNRQEKILELVTKYEIGTQDELIDRLHACGYGATQATVSRDIRALKLLKVLTENNSYRYIAPSATADSREDNPPKVSYRKTYAESIVSVDHAMNNVVVKTTPGMASAVALLLDKTNHQLMLGCVAGDDTIIVVTRTAEDAHTLSDNVKGQSRE